MPMGPITEEQIYDPSKLTERLAAKGWQTSEEIASHSSVLTNKRIDDIIRMIDMDAYSAMNIPDLTNLRAYFAGVNTLYNSVWMVFKEKQNKEMAAIRNDALKCLFGFDPEAAEDDPHFANSLFRFLFTIQRLDQYVRAELQKLRYFFKTEQADIRGIEASLAAIRFDDVL